MVDLETFPTNDVAKELLDSITKGWYERAYVGKWIYQVMGISLENAKKIYEALPEQFFVDTATWGLSYHEQKYGLPIRPELDYMQRRRLINQRTKSRVSMTPYHMELILKRQLGVDAEISDVHDSGSLLFQPTHPNIFKVTIWEQEKNTILDFEAVERQIQQIMQSHTTFIVEHRQVFQHRVSVNAGTLMTEMIEYEIMPRQINHDVDCTACVGVAAITDICIFEEITRKESLWR